MAYNEGLPYSEQISVTLLRRVCQKLSFKSPYENASI